MGNKQITDLINNFEKYNDDDIIVKVKQYVTKWNINTEEKYFPYHTLLGKAVSRNNIKLINFLLTKKPNVYGYLLTNIESVEIMEIILHYIENQGKLEKIITDSDNNASLENIKNKLYIKDIKNIKILLKYAKKYITKENSKGNYGYRLLELAIKADDVELIKILLNNGCLIDNSLFYFFRSVETMKILLEYAKSLNKLDNFLLQGTGIWSIENIELLKLILDYAKANGFLKNLLQLNDNTYRINILWKQKDIDMIKLLLEYAKDSINITEFISHKNKLGQNLLMNNLDKPEIVKLLIENGPDGFVNYVDNLGNNSLMFYFRRLTITNTGNLNYQYIDCPNRNISDDVGLWRLYKQNVKYINELINVDTIKLLLENGANIYSATNEFNMSPLDYVMSTYSENHKIRQLFIKYDINKRKPTYLEEIKMLLKDKTFLTEFKKLMKDIEC